LRQTSYEHRAQIGTRPGVQQLLMATALQMNGGGALF
jgi:hypothetical protein